MLTAPKLSMRRPGEELCRTRALVGGHFLCVFERAAVRGVGGAPGCPEGMAPDRLGDPRGERPLVDHAPGVRLTHRVFGQHNAA
jgi:hypothetical protein